MAKASDYKVITFLRKPGSWRANVMPIVAPCVYRKRYPS
jgi:hypothetical protein